MPRTLLLDAPSLVYRAFFALPKTLTDEQGRAVNAVRGFMDMITWMLNERQPDALVCAFDESWRPDFRVEAYPGYKAARPEDPPELPWQFVLLADVLDAAGIRRAEAKGLEADDVIATLVQDAGGDETVHIVSGDRDLVCLVRDPNVRLLFPVKGVREMTEFDEAAVQERFGVPARLYTDFAILRGDASDGLPGVPGIGPVRAAKLLAEHGSLEGLLSNEQRLPDKLRVSLQQARGYLEAMRTVVGLVTDADVTLTPGGAPDAGALRALGERHNLGSSTGRLLQALGAA